MRRRFLTLLFVLFPACGGGDPLPRPATIVAVAETDNQTAPAGAPLASPLAVLVRSDAGVGVVGAAVRWTLTEGAGAVLSDSVTVSDGTGRAEATLRLGPTSGAYRVRATLVPVPEQAVVLSATATAPPSLSAVTPSTFAGGDTLALTGSALGAGLVVEIGGTRAQVLSATATAATVIAPHCLIGGPVQLRALLQGAASNVLTATYTALTGPLTLRAGEHVSVDPNAAAGCTEFPAAGMQGAEYLVAVQAATGSPGLTETYLLRGDSVVDSLVPTARPGTPLPPAVQFHDFLRDEERRAAARPRPAGASPAVTELAAVGAVGVGDRREFRVCSVLTCQQEEDFARVSAVARWVGAHAAIFVDQQAPTGFSDADLDSLGRLFDDDLYEVDTRAFGGESDVDRNGVVAILFTPVVNGLTQKSQCQTSIITGFFFGIDIDPAFQNDPRSNKGEVFYALAPDPQGTVTCDLTVDAVRRFVQVTFVHEFQHMISYNQHVLLRGGEVEVLWLNEALSHLAEELAAFRFEARGDNERFTRFAIGDLFNSYLYLLDPGAFFALPGTGTGSLEERGAAWLFVRWLGDQFGPDLSRRLVETRRRGQDNVAAATGEPLSRLLAEWQLANFVSDLPGFTAPARLTYTTWRFRTTFQSLHDQLPSRFPRPFPLVPVVLSGGTGMFTGALRSGSGDYFRVVQAPADPGFTLQLTAGGGTPLPATIVPRMNVIRIR